MIQLDFEKFKGFSIKDKAASDYMNAASDLAISQILINEQEDASQSVPVPPMTPPEAARRYCLLLLIVTLIAIPACIRLGCSDFFLHHGASIWVQSNDAVFNMRDRDCDVLIFGDSTAMTGIDPDVVERNTGLKTCNISVTNAVLAVTHNLTLDSFLENNMKPRVLLIQLSPDGFQPESKDWSQTVYPEGLLELLRHGNPARVRHVLLTHPQEAIAFAGYAAGFSLYAGIKDVWFHLTNMRPEEDTVSVHNGFFTPPAPPTKSCEPGATFSNPAAGGTFPRSVVEEYEKNYAGRSGVVLVNVAPIPSCDANLAAFSSELNGVTSNALLPLPVTLFNDPRHYTAIGSAVVSKVVADELNAVAQHNPQIEDNSPPSAPRTVASLLQTHLGRR